jgi:nitrite reductase (NO-forming)
VEMGPRRRPISRDADRRITAGGLLLAAGFVALALGSVLLPADSRRGAWLPLHLALPGAATVAVGSVLPFFLAALAAARPGSPTLRVAVIALIAAGALSVSVGFAAGSGSLATIGGVAFIAGLAGLAWLLVAILGGALGPQRGLLPRAYATAIASVITGAALATAYVAGWAPVVERWASLKPAHAWLNVFGFLGLVIASTLVHLYPTVVGARIGIRPSTRAALIGLAAGPPAIALGYAVGSDVLARVGALVILLGVAALGAFIAEVHGRRGRWTTDAAWHRFTSWSLALGGAWYGVGVAIAAGRVLALGSAPVGWGVDLVGVPLALGFVLQVLVGSWTHLLPAIGPGDQRLHARQRALLARGADARLVALNAGALLLAVAVPLGAGAAAAVGALVAGGALLAGLGLFGRAMFLPPDARPEATGKAGQARL